MKNVLYINAGAGSGKTYRLTHDLADLLAGTNNNGHNPGCKQIDPSEIIVTTFTVPAANEIKERARKALLEDKTRDLSAVASKLETATIGTIHSVAQMFINKYWYAIGMVPDADVMSEIDKKLYRNQSIAQMLKCGRFANERQKIQKYYDTFRPKKQVDNKYVDYPEFWTELLDRIVSKMSYYEIEDLTNSKAASLAEVDEVFTSDDKPNDTEYSKMRKQMICIIEKVLKIKYIKKDDDILKEIQKLPKHLSYYAVWKLSSNIDRYIKTLSDIHIKNKNIQEDIDKLNRKKSLTDEQKQKFEEKQKELQNRKGAISNPLDYKDLLDGYKTKQNHWLTSTYYGQIITDCIDALFTLAGEWQKDYDDYKKRMGIIDYDDMEKGLRELLKIEAIKNEIASQYKLVMVDEFQDCNPIQLEIFDKLSDLVHENSPLEQSSVWVGDPNQAIFGFRGSNTELINDVADNFPKKNGQPAYGVADNNGLMRDKLDKSYRSRGALVNLAYKTFSPLFPQMVQLGVVCPENQKYQQAVYHWHFEDGGNSTAEYHLNLARKIKQTVEGKKFYVVPKKEEDQQEDPLPRLLEYKDIAVLVSKHKEAGKLAHEMKCAGVPVSVVEGDIFDRIEVQLMLSLMRLAERSNDHEWVSVMHLWCDKDTKEIIRNAIDDYAAIKTLAEGVKYVEWYKKETAYNSISEALTAVKGMSFDDRLSNLILLLSVSEVVAKWGEADTRRQNLITLQTQATAFANRCNRLGIDATVEEFVIYLNDIDIKPAKDLTSDTVKIITYHSSKGLEWPMVILASLNETRADDKSVKKSFCGVTEQKEENSKYKIVVFPDFLGQSFSGAVKDAITALPRFNDVREAQKGDAQRLMYVGMTRAREYLVAATFGLTVKSNWLEEMGVVQGIDGFDRTAGVTIENSPAVDKYEGTRHEIPLGTYQETNRKPLGGDGFIDAIVSPSKIAAEGECKAQFTPHMIDGIHFFPHGNGGHDDNNASLGTCIHNVFAAYDPSLPADTSVTMADKVIRQHGFGGCLEPERVINSISKLYDWLRENYGGGHTHHEVPFRHVQDDSTIVRGEMDLLWETTSGVVLIDFKNFISRDINAPLAPSRPEHYVGKYVPQIEAYTKALKANNMNVIARLIYYSTLGVVVDL